MSSGDGINVARLLAAVVRGGNVLAAASGARKVRRRVPAKQERLLRLVVERGEVGLAELVEAFPVEWARIRTRRKGKAILLAKRDFFRNMADLAARVNAALLAGYADADTSEAMLDDTGGEYVGLRFDYQAFTVAWTVHDALADLRAAVEAVEEKRHARLTDAPPGGSVEEHPANVDAEELVVAVDPVTGSWRFELDGHEIEVAPRHGLVRVDGRVHEVPVVRDLDAIEDLAGAPLAWIRELLQHLAEREQFD